MQQIKLDETTAARRRIPVALVDDTDGKTPETGVTLSAGDMKISKNGGAEANHAGTLNELATGDYYYEATAGEVDTLGYLTGKIAKTGIRTFRFAAQVVAFDPYTAPPTVADINSAVEAGQVGTDAATAAAGDVLTINGDATAAANLAKTTRAIGRGTATTGGTTTSIPTSAFAPASAGAVADQFKGRIVTFDADTTTAALRGQSTDITANTSGATPTFTVTALTTAPASGDTFSVT